MQPNLFIDAKKNMKVCTKCTQEKFISDFAKNKKYRSSWCKACCREDMAKRRVWDKDNVARIKRLAYIKSRFGLSADQYDQMMAKQNGKCAICFRPESVIGYSLAIDHCHTTGKIRSLLCRQCNLGLGNFYENPSRLVSASNYIRQQKGQGAFSVSFICDPIGS